MSSVRSVTLVPAGLDPFARRRTVTNPITGQAVSTAPLTGPTVTTTPLGPPGPAGAPGVNTGASVADYSGHGPPPQIILGASPGQTYLNLDTLDLYRLE